MYNANNYGYNPYGTYMPQRPMQQEQFNAVQTRSMLNGKQVDSIDVAKNIDYPLDGSVSYFPLIDGSAIVSKQLNFDGTSKVVVFKPITDDKKQEISYITKEDLINEINKIEIPDVDDLKDDIKDLKQEIKDLKKTKAKIVNE